jgi:hypothetical protein
VVKRIDFGSALAIFANEKVVMSRKGDADHFTLHCGPISKILDIHRTRTVGGLPAHETLFAITHEKLAEVMEEIAPALLEAFIEAIRPFDPNKLETTSIIAFTGLSPSGEALAKIVTRRKGRLLIDPKKMQAGIRRVNSASEMCDLPDGETFTIFSGARKDRRRKLGSGFMFTDERGRRRAAWVPDNRLKAALNRAGDALLESLAKRQMNDKALQQLAAKRSAHDKGSPERSRQQEADGENMP